MVFEDVTSDLKGKVYKPAIESNLQRLRKTMENMPPAVATLVASGYQIQKLVETFQNDFTRLTDEQAFALNGIIEQFNFQLRIIPDELAKGGITMQSTPDEIGAKLDERYNQEFRSDIQA